jgi:hypothetical protein
MPTEQQDQPPDPCERTAEQIAEDERRSKRAEEIAAGKAGVDKKEPAGAKAKTK